METYQVAALIVYILSFLVVAFLSTISSTPGLSLLDVTKISLAAMVPVFNTAAAIVLLIALLLYMGSKKDKNGK